MKRVILSIVVLAIFILAGCGNDYDTNPTSTPSFNINEPTPTPVGEITVKPVEGGTITLGVSKFNTLNPLTTDNEDIKYYMSLIYDPLFKLDYQQNALPSLGIEAKTEDNGTTWRIKLREDVLWHDGQGFTAADCVYTINFLLKNSSLYEVNVSNIEDCTLVDEFVFSIKLKEPDLFIPGKLTFPIIPASNAGIGSKPVGTSMYKHMITENNKMVLVRNEGYWDDKPYIETVEIHMFENERLKYESDSDILLLTGPNVSRYLNKAGYISYKYIGRSYMCMMPNLSSNNVVNDVNVRKALMYMIDVDKVINASVSGNGIGVAWPVMPGTMYTQDSARKYNRDLDKANEYLQQAGYYRHSNGNWYKTGDTERRYPLTIPCNVLSGDVEMRNCAESVKKQLEELGVIFTINYQSEKDYETALKGSAFTLALVNINISSWPDIEPLFSTSGSMNIFGYTNPELDDILANLFISNDVLRDTSRIKDILDNELPLLGLYIAQEAIVMSEKIYGKELEYNFWNPFGYFNKLHLFTEGIVEE